MYNVYVLWSDKLHKRYIGFTSNLTQRLSGYNSGKSPFTKSGKLWKVIYKEEFSTKNEASKREKFLKSGVGRKFLDLMFTNQNAGVPYSG